MAQKIHASWKKKRGKGAKKLNFFSDNFLDLGLYTTNGEEEISKEMEAPSIVIHQDEDAPILNKEEEEPPPYTENDKDITENAAQQSTSEFLIRKGTKISYNGHHYF